MSHQKDPNATISIMSYNKESPSSTPPATHIEDTPTDYDSKGRRFTSVPGEPPLQEHGVGIDHIVPQADAVQLNPDLTWSKIRHSLREPFAEFWGTFVLIMFGDGVVAQVVLSDGKKGDFQSINWGWG